MNGDLLTVAEELAEVARLVEADDLQSTLDRCVIRIKRTVPGCDHACISVGAASGGVETVAGLDEPLFVECPDDAAGEPSPILEAMVYREPRRLADIDADRRWPAFATVMRRTGYRSAIALPLAGGSDAPAVLTLFSRKPDQFTDTAYDLALLFTLHAGVAFDNARLYHDSQSLVSNLRQALVTRSTIGQAQGILMHARGWLADQALDALKGSSQNFNIKLRDLATSLVAAQDGRVLDDYLRSVGLHG